MRRWLHSGAHRRATGGRTYDDHSAAVMTFDVWWTRMVHRIYDPVIGQSLVRRISDEEGLDLGQPPTSSGFFGGWQSQVLGVLHKVLGERNPSNPAGRYCGRGTLAGCRHVLRGALHGATARLVKANGGNPAAWRKPVLCPKQSTPTCDENLATTAGAVDTPPQPFENRGTFHQAVEIK
jgi:hypothetical protein